MTEPVWAAEEIEERLQAQGTPERAESEKRYLKSELRHLGATVPQVRREARRAGAELSTRVELPALVMALWSEPVHERRSCAAYLLQACGDLLEPADVELLERLVREARTWALVDVLAGDVLGPLLVRFPDTINLDTWAADEDFWFRRSALLAQIEPLRAGFLSNRSLVTPTRCWRRRSSSSARRSAGYCAKRARADPRRCTGGFCRGSGGLRG